jgi:hypothetical protein
MEEIWKDILEYEGFYQVSNLGRVKSLKKTVFVNKNSGFYKVVPEKIMKLIKSHNGYYHVNLYDSSRKMKSFRINRLVLEVFNRKPLFNEVSMHLDNDKSNNNLTNLKWGTQKENVKQTHVEKRNRNISGMNNHMCKHNDDFVKNIKQMYHINNLSIVNISKQLNIKYMYVYEIVKNIKRKNVQLI